MSLPNLQATRAAIAHAVRKGDAQAEASARRRHAVAAIKHQIARVELDAPPLDAADRYELALYVLGDGYAACRLTEARLEAHIRAAIEGSVLNVPLTAEQRIRLSALMRGLTS